MWSYLRRWDTIFSWAGARWVLIAMAGFWIGKASSEKNDLMMVMIVVAFGFMANLLQSYTDYEESLAERALKYEDYTSEDAITEDAYVTTNKDGVKTVIPWEIMEITEEGPGYWRVDYGDSAILVYLESLEQAGLVEEFRSRIGKKPETPDQPVADSKPE